MKFDERFSLETASIRRRVITAIYKSKKGHIGGALSCTDIIWSLFATRAFTPHPGGNRTSTEFPLVMSKGHSATALLAALCELGMVDDQLMDSYNKPGSLVGNNPSEMVSGIEFHAGSLGHGVGFASGIALSRKISADERRVGVLISDGELHEGSTWESLLFAAHHKLNLCVLVDNNQQICEDLTKDVLSLEHISQLFTNMGYQTHNFEGHRPADLLESTIKLKNSKGPIACIYSTIKGKGVSFMERNIRFHHSIPTEEEFMNAMIELDSTAGLGDGQ
jgi:transketolase